MVGCGSDRSLFIVFASDKILKSQIQNVAWCSFSLEESIEVMNCSLSPDSAA